jgi:hypothetical protein
MLISQKLSQATSLFPVSCDPPVSVAHEKPQNVNAQTAPGLTEGAGLTVAGA